MPKISVIVPVYKVEQYLDRCVESILAQTFSDFELILVDDGSPDNCPAMCDEWAKKDNRIVVIHKQNGGLSDARNAAIDWTFANSDSEWLTFIDSDDWVHIEYLERLYNAAVENNVAVSGCSFYRTEGEAPIIEKQQYNVDVCAPEDFYVSRKVYSVIACAKLYKKTCFDVIRYPLGKLHEDEFTTYKILFAFDKLSFIPAPMYFYFQNSEGITANLSIKHFYDVVEAVEMQMKFFEDNAFLKAMNYQKKKVLYIIAGMYQAKASDSDSKIIKKKLRFYLRKYSAVIQDYPLIYEVAYPNFMKFYWLLQTIKHRFKRGKDRS